MTSASQFSLEEENFYKDIQDLVKKGSQNEKELSTFLQRYIDLLARSDLDDEIFLINFTKAAFILELTAKVYGNKVDLLWLSLEKVLEALKFNGKTVNGKKGAAGGENDDEVADGDGEAAADGAEPLKKVPNTKKRKKLGDALSCPDDFIEIDNISGLLGKNMNEAEGNVDVRVKFLEEIPNLFLRNKTDRKRVDVCLVQETDDRDDSRLRDWILSEDMMLVKEMYVAGEMESSVAESTLASINGERYSMEIDEDDHADFAEPLTECSAGDKERGGEEGGEAEAVTDKHCQEANNNSENVPDAALGWLCPSETSNKSQEVEMGKFPNPVGRWMEECLVDVNAVCSNPSKLDNVIPNKKSKMSKATTGMCKLCSDKKAHSKKGRRCVAPCKLPALDEDLSPGARSASLSVATPLEPDEDLYKTFLAEMRLIDKLLKAEKTRNVWPAFHGADACHDASDFSGFDDFDQDPLRLKDDFRDGDNDDDDDFREFGDVDEAGAPHENGDVTDHADAGPDAEDELPLPDTVSRDVYTGSTDTSSAEVGNLHLKIINDAIHSEEAKKSQFERNKELGLRVGNWHASLTSQLELSQKRGALNMDVLGEEIMRAFRSAETSTLAFRDLVKNCCRRDVPRYFFASLQLTNEGNVDIVKDSREPLATDCMVIKRLRETRVRHELDEYTTNTNSPKKAAAADRSRSASTSKRKRDSGSRSSSPESGSEKQARKKATKAQVEDRKRKAGSERRGRKKRRDGDGDGEGEGEGWTEEFTSDSDSSQQ